MKIKTYNIAGLILFFSFTIPNMIFAQTSGFPQIPPSMISQFGNMSTTQQNALAAQYGISLDNLSMGNNISGNNELDKVNSEVNSEANEILYQRIIDSEENSKIAREYKKRNDPIFEQDYLTIRNLPIYGQYLFDGDFSSFAPLSNTPVPSDYVMGPGDSLRVLMYGIRDSEITLLVNRDGSINFPELGSISIAGMTFIEASEYIKSRVSKQMIGAEVSISIGRLKTMNIFVAGEAKVPGSYSVSGLSNVSQALYAAGGVTDIGSLRDIQVKRSNKLIVSFDLYDLLTKGNAEGDIRLQSGDVIFIPTSQKNIYIDGAVKRPGRYELKENETISDLINLVGGLDNRAYLKQVYIERYDHSKGIPSIINLDLTNNENLKFKISDGDIVKVAEVTQRLSNSVSIKGAVNRPGKYGWYEGVRFSDILSSINTDFSSNFDMNKGLIIRRKDINNFDIEVIDFSIKEALSATNTEMDPLLNLYDEVLIFSLGFNDDVLNDIEIYDEKLDVNNPSYGNDKDDETIELLKKELSLQNTPMTKPTEIESKNLMTYKELEIELYNNEKEAEFNFKNKGKRRLLLESVIDKLNQQASSTESPKLVSISGAVKVPGQYPLPKNASYMDLIELAGGYKDDAFIEAAEIRKTLVDTYGALAISTSNVDLSRLSETKLEGLDHLHIRNVKDWDAKDTVILSGEVFYPGAYLISPNETLSSVIERAGGFTNESFIGGAIFTRESIKLKEREQLQILGDNIRRDQAARSMTKESEDFAVSSSEVEAGIKALLSSEVYGRLIIDIPGLMSGDSTADIALQDGDILTIPKFTNAVTVVGEVRRSGSFVLQKNYTVGQYLQLAAGMTARGDKKEIYIISADGSVKKSNSRNNLLTFESNRDEIQAGDTIVVPIKSSYQTPLNLYSTVSQVVFQSIASIAAFSTIFK